MSASSSGFWRDVDGVFAQVADADPPQRAALLDALCAGRADLRAEVESLLRAHSAAEASGFLAAPEPCAAVSPDPRVGSRVGSYRLLERIGAGGMGVVYRAERDDGDFDHRIAVKVLTASAADAVTSRRFHSERQILAAISHPNVVTLLDAGLTGDGHAYLAMEYIAGVPVAEYCRVHALSLVDRINLLRQVCAAVQHLHQYGVVHRDLKPANILVTPDGVAKVLDFGIAKLVTDEDSAPGGVTRDAPLLTPNYASPEQIRGLSATSAADVYALGVIAYELLSGVRPYETDGRTLDDVIRMVVDVEVVRPSAAAPAAQDGRPYGAEALRGDLDAVVLRALRKAPVERYASAAALADDLGRYLSGLPVEAREPSLGYVLAKLARRHTAAFVSTGVSAVLILALLAAAFWEAAAARAQRVRAERRFSEVRRLADTLIFNVEDAVTPLPGSTPVRQMLVKEGLAYLEQLRADAGGDRALQVELARAYVKIGTVQGRPNTANLGDSEGALASFARAEALTAPLADSPSASLDAIRARVAATSALSETLVNIPGRRAEAAAVAARGVITAERFAARHAGLDAARETLGNAYFAAARVVEGQPAIAAWTRARDTFAALLPAHPDDANLRRSLALTEKYIGAMDDDRGDSGEALDHYQRAATLDEQRAAAAPSDRVAAFDVAIDLGNLAHVQKGLRHYPESESLYRRSLSIRQRLADSDPRDVLARAKVAFAHRELGYLNETTGNRRAALEHFREAAAIYASTGNGVDTQRNLAAALGELGVLEPDRARACAAASRAFELYVGLSESERLVVETPDPLPKVASLAEACGSARARAWAQEHRAAVAR